MNRIVVYTSKTGFTATYAKWIAQELDCPVKELKEMDVTSLQEYEQVIYGGWLMGGMISGLDKIKSVPIKNLVIFATGMSAPSETVLEIIDGQNKITLDNVFYFEGGYAPEKVGFFGRIMIKMVVASVRKKEEKTQEELRMLETAKGADRTRKEAIIPLVEYVRKSEAE